MASKPIRILGLGDNVCDKYVHSKKMYPGGQALNVAVFASMLGAHSEFFGVFGTDPVALHVTGTLDALHIPYPHSRRYEGANGYAMVRLLDGDRVFLGSNRGGVLQSHPILLNEADLQYIQSFDLVHTSNNSYIDGQLKRISDTGVCISYDFSSSWRDADRRKSVCPHIHFAFLSCGDMPTEEIFTLMKSMQADGCRHVMATRGARGALFLSGDRLLTQQPHFVEPVDTLGAGDAFAAAFLVSLLRHQKAAPNGCAVLCNEGALTAILEDAAAFSAKTCLVHGAFGYETAMAEAPDGDRFYSAANKSVNQPVQARKE